MQDILLLKPIFKKRIWGGTRLKTQFNYEINSDKIGECWGISAHKNGDSTIINGALKGKTLSAIYCEFPNLFNNIKSDKFPLLVKILDANEDLSVQVHPDDLYSQKHENEFGKNECWYVLDAIPNASIVYGTSAKNRDVFQENIKNNTIENILLRKEVKKGDFINVDAGTVHSIGKGIMILETQQSSDVTYRIYDYNRVDEFGSKRELHIENALDVINYNKTFSEVEKTLIKDNDCDIIKLIENKHFKVYNWQIKENYQFISAKFHLLSVISGSGKINNIDIRKGDHMIVTSLNNNIKIIGELEIIVSTL